MTDKQIIALFFKRDEQAVQEIESKYGDYCTATALSILGNQQDAQEAVNDTWLYAWNSIPPQVPKVLRMFLAKIARNRALDIYRREHAKFRGGNEISIVLEELGECISDGSQVDDYLNEKELEQAIRRFLDTIPQRDQNIFIRRYFFVEDAADIALRYGLRKGAVLTILSRIRQKLKVYLKQEGYNL